MLQDLGNRAQTADADGILAVYDSTRLKWLSAARTEFPFGANHLRATSPRWLRTAGLVPSNVSGYRVPRDATITAMTLQASVAGSAGFKVKVLRAGVTIDIVTVTATVEREKTWSGLDYDLQSGDSLMIEMVTGEMDYPVFVVELAWRLTI